MNFNELGDAGKLALIFGALCFLGFGFLNSLAALHHTDNWALASAYSLFISPIMAIACAIYAKWILAFVFLILVTSAIYYLRNPRDEKELWRKRKNKH